MTDTIYTENGSVFLPSENMPSTMSDEAKKMSVVFCHEFLLTAAVWLATKSHRQILQFKRVGDKLEVIGSNCYILVSGEINASFTDWDDGVAVKIESDPSIYALLNMFKVLDVDEMPHELEVIGKSATYSIGGYSAQAKALFTIVSTEPLDMDRVIGLASESPEGHALMSSGNLRIIAKLTKMLGLAYNGWYIEPHGKNKAMVLRLKPEEDQGNILIMAMPQKEG